MHCFRFKGALLFWSLALLPALPAIGAAVHIPGNALKPDVGTDTRQEDNKYLRDHIRSIRSQLELVEKEKEYLLRLEAEETREARRRGLTEHEEQEQSAVAEAARDRVQTLKNGTDLIQENSTRSKDFKFLWFDSFWLIYWSSVLAVILVIVAGLWLLGEFTFEEEVADGLLASSSVKAGQESISSDGRISHRHSFSEHAREVPQELELPSNMWAMVILASIGQVKTESEAHVSPYAIFGTAILTCGVQGAILGLLLTDIDPNAKPVTVQPSVPWADAWTVNTMKWLMGVVLCVALSSELHEIKRSLRGVFYLDPERISCNYLLLPASEAMHYLVTVAVVWAAMSVILSFQSCPDIIYSSLAITFVANIDDMYYTFACTVFDLEVEFVIKFTNKARKIPRKLHWFLKLAAIFPLLLGVYLVSRACYTGVMPYARFQKVVRGILGIVAL